MERVWDLGEKGEILVLWNICPSSIRRGSYAVWMDSILVEESQSSRGQAGYSYQKNVKLRLKEVGEKKEPMSTHLELNHDARIKMVKAPKAVKRRNSLIAIQQCQDPG